MLKDISNYIMYLKMILKIRFMLKWKLMKPNEIIYPILLILQHRSGLAQHLRWSQVYNISNIYLFSRHHSCFDFHSSCVRFICCSTVFRSSSWANEPLEYINPFVVVVVVVLVFLSISFIKDLLYL